MTDERQLLSEYNEYRDHTAHIRKLRAAGRYIRGYKASEKNLAPMRELMAWCKERSIEPRQWLYTLFHTRHWLYAPPLDKLRSEKHRAKFQNVEMTPFYSNRVQRELVANAQERGDTYDPNRDLSGTTENLKRFYLDAGRQQECMDSVQATLGYHPRSLVCARCQLQAACGAQLQASVSFDILALRRGELSAEQARQQALLYAARS